MSLMASRCVPRLHDLLGQVDVVLEVVLGPLRIGDVARVADRRLDDLAALLGRLDRHLHAVDVVERVEDPEHVDAGGGRLLDERHHDVVRVVGVADGVGAAQQHLEHHVRDKLAQLVQAQPRDPPRGTGRRRRRWRRPTSRSRTARSRCGRSRGRPSRCRRCAAASPAATGARRARWCRSAARADRRAACARSARAPAAPAPAWSRRRRRARHGRRHRLGRQHATSAAWACRAPSGGR